MRARIVVTAALVSCASYASLVAFGSAGYTRSSTTRAEVVHVIGHKWWWELQYPASVAGTQFSTAFELHVPVGRPVELHLSSADVIHSFWVPSLHGKRDALPGKPATLVLQADEVGTYEGQCAEYCGMQHANMRFYVVAQREEDVRAWLARESAPARAPAEPQTLAGQQVFQQSRCSACHAISGTEAHGSAGPDLTHLASRKGLATGTLDNEAGHLAGWIVDPRSKKPGVLMPGTRLPPEDLLALVAYLRSLE